eukprot:12880265-Alexandrium_andersonii.AAC.1
MVCLQSLQEDATAAAQRERFDSAKYLVKMEPEDAEIMQVDADLQNANESDSEEAWRAMAEGRWRWETRGAISAR